jgi:exopolysaccharide biosynthesis polyprenyl glycosylphosphotransferase
MEKEKQPKRVAIYGTGTLAAVVEEELRRRVSLRYEVVGFVQPRAEIIHPAVTPVIGSLANLRELTQNYKIDTVIFASEDHTEEELTQVLAHCSSANLDTRTAPELFEVVMGEVNLEHLRFPLWDPSVFPARGWYLRWKRILDFFISGCSLILASPLMLLIALAIRSNSAGPVIFRQPRTGLRGKEFTLYKFRTMTEKTTMHAEDDPEDDLKRMSSVGKFLRLTRLDEMPQLFNVLKGDMSLVGPRAEWTKRAKEMARVIPYFEQRYLVRPGMTGWSQVEYKYTTSPAEYRKKTQYDLYYIKNMSFALDVRILLKTIWVVLTAKGAR